MSGFSACPKQKNGLRKSWDMLILAGRTSHSVCLGHNGVQISLYLDGEPKLALMAAQIDVINIFTWPPSVDGIATPFQSLNKAPPSLPTTPEWFQGLPPHHRVPGHVLHKCACHATISYNKKVLVGSRGTKQELLFPALVFQTRSQNQ